LLFNTEVQE